MENRIKEFRARNGISQADLGKTLNVTGATISSWEMGRTEPSIEQCLKMTRLFDCSLEELFCNKPLRYDYTTKEQLLIECYRKSDNTTKEMVQRLLAYTDLLKGE